MIKAIFLDVANTLLHKPNLIKTFSGVLRRHGVDIPDIDLMARHRLLSELVVFPDRTSKSFYREFNAELLRSFGIVPHSVVLDDIFAACSYLAWHPFDDVSTLQDQIRPLGILSNWDKSLPKQLEVMPDLHFKWILGSENENLRKPDKAFFERILDETKLSPSQIAYIGDSVKLDIEPALGLGLSAFLIDRDDLYPYASVPRLRSFAELDHRL
jgi:FMN phosphatase YigB (HAD superfamily)